MTKNKIYSIFAIMAIAIVSISFFHACSEDKILNENNTKGLLISDYNHVTSDYLSKTNGIKAATPWQDVVAADGAGGLAGGLTGGLVGGWAGVGIGGIVGGGLCSLDIENMLHNYYLQNEKSKLAHKTLIWMSIHRRGAEYWSYVNSIIFE